MRRFKFKRNKFEENLKLKSYYLLDNQKSANRDELQKFFHTKNQVYVSDFIKPMGNHPLLENLGQRKKTNKEKMNKIEKDFENCISNNILSEKQLLRLKKKNFFIKRQCGAKMPKGSTVDTVGLSLKALRKMHNRSKLNGLVEEGMTFRSHRSMIKLGGGNSSSIIGRKFNFFGERSQREKKQTYITSTRENLLTQQSHKKSSLFSRNQVPKLPIFNIGGKKISIGAKSHRITRGYKNGEYLAKQLKMTSYLGIDEISS